MAADIVCNGLNENDILEINYYYIFKGILSLLYCDDYEKRWMIIEDTLNITYNDFLVPLSNILVHYKDVLDEQMKKNIYSITDFFRNKYVCEDETIKVQLNKTINDIISITNNGNTSALKEFIKNEWVIRFNDKEYKKIEKCGKIYDSYSQLKILFMQDYDILFTHLSCYDDEFETVSEAYADVNSIYMASISKMICECPCLFKDVSFLMRVNDTIELYRSNLENSNISECILPKKELIKRFKIDKKYFTDKLFETLSTD